MDSFVSINDLIAHRYDSLSPQLKLAADFVSRNHQDVASRSLRAIASESELKPPTFSRLARALGLTSYEDMRELCRREVRDRTLSFSEKAEILRSAEELGPDRTPVPFALRQSASAITNIERLAHELDIDRLRRVADLLIASKRVFLAGSLASGGFVHYLGYLASLAFDNWRIIGANGYSLPIAMTGIGEGDAVIVILKEPYARRSVHTAKIAHESGALVIVITDGISCPALQYATHHFIVPTDSPQFFSSYVATLVLLESLMGMLIRRSGPAAQKRLAEVEINGHRLDEYWPATKTTSIREQV